MIGSVALAGCGVFGGTVTSVVPTSSCGQLPSGACSEQLDKIGARHPGAKGIDLVCGMPTCTRASGGGTATVTMADGTRISDVFAYTGDPAPMPDPRCTGLAPDLCRAVAAGRFEDTPPSKHVVRIDVRCTSATCVDEQGDADIEIAFADGTRQSGSVGWRGGRP